MPLRNLPRSRVMLNDSHPTILIDAAIAPKLVILGSPSIGSFGCIEGISHTYAVDRLLGNAADAFGCRLAGCLQYGGARSEEHTSELQSLMRISYAVLCLHKK